MSSAKNTQKRIQKRPVRRRTAPARTRRKSSPAGIVIGIVGWLASAALIAYLISIRVDTQKKLSGIDAQFKRDLAELQETLNRHQERVRERSSNLIGAIDEQNRLQRELEAKIQLVADEPEQLETQRDALKGEVAQLDRKVASLREEAGLTGESRSEVIAKLRDAQFRRNDLKQKYIQNYYKMLEDYQETIHKNNPEQSQRFFFSHRDTPFAPAAAYHAAELFRMDGDAHFALRMYREIVKNYSDSYYAARSQARISMVEDEQLGWDQIAPAVIQLHPYKALDIVN